MRKTCYCNTREKMKIQKILFAILYCFLISFLIHLNTTLKGGDLMSSKLKQHKLKIINSVF